MCYGDAGSAVRELKKQGLTQTEATPTRWLFSGLGSARVSIAALKNP